MEAARHQPLDPLLGGRSPERSDGADNNALLDQWDAASRRNNSIESEQIVEMHKVDTVLEDLGFAPESTTATFSFQFRFFASPTAT